MTSKIMPKKKRSPKESSLAPNFEAKLYFRAIYPSAISVNPTNRTNPEKRYLLSNVSNNPNDSIIRNKDMILGIDLLNCIQSEHLQKY